MASDPYATGQYLKSETKKKITAFIGWASNRVSAYYGT